MKDIKIEKGFASKAKYSDEWEAYFDTDDNSIWIIKTMPNETINYHSNTIHRIASGFGDYSIFPTKLPTRKMLLKEAEFVLAQKN